MIVVWNVFIISIVGLIVFIIMICVVVYVDCDWKKEIY